MQTLIWLDHEEAPHFPNTRTALEDPNGLLAVGGKLDSTWLLEAYKKGIFPWFSDGEPIMWWSPAPRMVLQPGTAHISRSLIKQFRKMDIEIRTNTAFAEVIHQCSDSAMRSEGTWITQEIIHAYEQLHKEGWAHSVEVWQQSKLVGGLYGIGISNTFFGESMFSLIPSASKFAFIALSEWAFLEQLTMIDCQLYNPYLDSLGAKLIERDDFEKKLPTLQHRLSLVHKPILTDALEQAIQKKRQ